MQTADGNQANNETNSRAIAEDGRRQKLDGRSRAKRMAAWTAGKSIDRRSLTTHLAMLRERLQQCSPGLRLCPKQIGTVCRKSKVWESGLSGQQKAHGGIAQRRFEQVDSSSTIMN